MGKIINKKQRFQMSLNQFTPAYAVLLNLNAQPMSFAPQQLQNLRSTHEENYFYSAGYLAQSAQDKQDDLWTNIIADTRSNSWPGVKLADIFLESMEPTFDWPGDAFQENFLGQPARGKWIHSVGAITKVTLETVSNPFTGIFKGA